MRKFLNFSKDIMKIFLFVNLLILCNCRATILNFKDISSSKKEYAAGENIKVYRSINKDYLFTIDEGEIFLTEDNSENKEWRKIYFEDKEGFISKSNKLFTVNNSAKNITDDVFLTHNKLGTILCKKIPRNGKCLEEIRNLEYLEKIKFIKPYQHNDGSGASLKVYSENSIGYINRLDLIPESIFKSEQVEAFKNKFQKICTTQVKYLRKNTNICYSTKIFKNGDANEYWNERVYFMVDRDSNSFAYGRKYLETFGIIFKVDTINENSYKVHFLNSLDFSKNHLLVEIDLKKNSLYAPIPETIMPNTYKQESTELLEFKNKLNYSR